MEVLTRYKHNVRHLVVGMRSQPEITAAVVSEATNLGWLGGLDVSHREVGAELLEQIAHSLSGLTVLRLSACRGVDTVGMTAVARCTSSLSNFRTIQR